MSVTQLALTGKYPWPSFSRESNWTHSSLLQVPFLNLMSLIEARAGRVHVRVGGNTQETATLVASLPDGKAIEKQKADNNNPVRTSSVSLI